MHNDTISSSDSSSSECLSTATLNDGSDHRSSVAYTGDNTSACLPNRPARPFFGKYMIKETIGKGAQGKVKAATNVTTNKEVAIKLISKAAKPDALARSIQERVLLGKIPYHHNICNMVESAETEQFVAIVMERGERDLYDAIEELGHLPIVSSKRMIKQLLLALQHCHAHGVAHRDIKPENILLSGSPNPAVGTAKLCDFGLAKDFSEKHISLLASRVGTQGYASPEMIEGLEYDGSASDIFSLGVVLYSITTSFEPWSCAVATDVVFDRFSRVPSEFWIWARAFSPEKLCVSFENLFNGMCCVDPARRWTASECLAHPFFNDMET